MDNTIENKPTPTTERTMDSRNQLRNVRSLARISLWLAGRYRSDHGPLRQHCRIMLEEDIRMHPVVSRLDERDLETLHAMILELLSLFLIQ